MKFAAGEPAAPQPVDFFHGELATAPDADVTG